MQSKDLKEVLSDLSGHQEFVVVPRSFSGMDYDFIIGLQRLSEEAFSKQTEEYNLGNRWDLNRKNTAIDTLGRSFIGKNTHDNTLELNRLAGFSTPTLREFKEFLHLLKQGCEENIEVNNYSRGYVLTAESCYHNLQDIVGMNKDTRAELLDTAFIHTGLQNVDSLVLACGGYDHFGDFLHMEKLDKNSLIGKYEIDFESWLKTSTSQGMPSKETKEGNMKYIVPEIAMEIYLTFFALGDQFGFGRIFFPGVSEPLELGIRPIIRL